MARGRGLTRVVQSRSRRQTTWIGPADQDKVAVGSGASVIIASFKPETNAMLAPTIIRSRGEVALAVSTFAADLAYGGAFGAAVVSDEAFAAGAASIPRPFSDANFGGWFVWQSFARAVEFISGVGFEANVNQIFQVDSKAMRKVKAGETIVLMAESQTGAFNIAMHLRLLFLMS